MTLEELELKLSALGDISDDQKKSIVCALIGHSKIITLCIGEVACGRCGEKIGDTLMGTYPMEDVVIIHHNCKVCRKNFKKLGWEDKFMVDNPFKKNDFAKAFQL
jgi:hypothetical protein